MRNYLLLILFACLGTSVCAQCDHPDFVGLLRMYESLDGENWDDNTGWKEASLNQACNPCSFNGTPWYGIECKNDRVVCIDLDGAPSCSSQFEGGNNLKGELIDWQLTALERLYLGGNDIYGELIDFTGLPNLQLLSIRITNISGSIPDFRHMPELLNLQLDINKLSGPLTDFSHMPKLSLIQLSKNELTGEIPYFINLPDLGSLFLNNNNLEGCFPLFLCDIKFEAKNNPLMDTNDLDWGYCFNGSIAGSCDLSVHPDFPALVELYEATNGDEWDQNFGWKECINGQSCIDICEWFGVTCQNGRVVCINLNGNTSCTAVSFLGNNLTGSLPNLKLDQLRDLNLTGNSIAGALPVFDEMPRLEHLRVAFNNFDGALPEFKTNENLKVIGLSYNLIDGVLPSYEHLSNLDNLSISHNNISGCYSPYLCNLEVFHAVENPRLPWYGVYEPYCEGEEQSEAPCESCDCMGFFSDVTQMGHAISIYPNPTASYFYIESFISELKYSIYGVNGNLMMKGVYQGEPIKIESFNPGVYILKLQSVSKTQTTQIVKI